MSVCRKFANMLEYFSPFSTMPQQQEDEAAPATKRRRLETSTTRSRAAAADADTVVDAHATDALTASPDDDTVAIAPTDAVTVVATSLPSSQASRAASPRKWKPEEDAKLIEAVNKQGGRNWIAIAALVPGRTDMQCRTRWAETLEPAIDQTTTRGPWKKTKS
jgi:hypothetical protein